MGPPTARLWDDRLRRIEELLPRRPEAAEMLGFFRALTEAQRDIARELVGRPTGDPRYLHFTPILRAVEKAGPPGLAAAVEAVRGMSTPDRDRLLMQAWNDDKGREEDPAKDFLARAVVAPFASYWAAHDPTPRASRPAGCCPYCGERPAVAVLRPDREAEALRRSLVCVRCATEWEHRRVGCPACGEEEPARLPRLSAVELPGLRVEGCDACGRYLKAVDLTAEPAAEPLVDELASPALDVVARGRGWVKIACNAAGI
jgi:formate dehydrogenase accessory protein FdhE